MVALAAVNTDFLSARYGFYVTRDTAHCCSHTQWMRMKCGEHPKNTNSNVKTNQSSFSTSLLAWLMHNGNESTKAMVVFVYVQKPAKPSQTQKSLYLLNTNVRDTHDA